MATNNLFQIQNQMCSRSFWDQIPRFFQHPKCNFGSSKTWVRRTSTLQQRQDGSAVSSISPPEIGLQMLQVEWNRTLEDDPRQDTNYFSSKTVSSQLSMLILSQKKGNNPNFPFNKQQNCQNQFFDAKLSNLTLKKKLQKKNLYRVWNNQSFKFWIISPN